MNALLVTIGHISPSYILLNTGFEEQKGPESKKRPPHSLERSFLPRFLPGLVVLAVAVPDGETCSRDAGTSTVDIYLTSTAYTGGNNAASTLSANIVSSIYTWSAASATSESSDNTGSGDGGSASSASPSSVASASASISVHNSQASRLIVLMTSAHALFLE